MLQFLKNLAGLFFAFVLICLLSSSTANAQSLEQDLHLRKQLGLALAEADLSASSCDTIENKRGKLELDINRLKELELEPKVITSLIGYIAISNNELCMQEALKTLETRLWDYHNFLKTHGSVPLNPYDPSFAIPIFNSDEASGVITVEIVKDLIDSFFTSSRKIFEKTDKKFQKLLEGQSESDVKILKDMIGDEPFDMFATMDWVEIELAKN